MQHLEQKEFQCEKKKDLKQEDWQSIPRMEQARKAGKAVGFKNLMASLTASTFYTYT